MPRGDRTGPNGMGPMTGRRAGVCAGNTTAGFGGAGYGRGPGQGTGGRFCGRGFWGRLGFGRSAVPYSVPDTQSEKSVLNNQAQAVQAELDLIKKRLEEIDKQDNPQT